MYKNSYFEDYTRFHRFEGYQVYNMKLNLSIMFLKIER